MRSLFLFGILVAVAFYYYTFKLKPNEEAEAARQAEAAELAALANQPKELTVNDLHRLASMINLEGLATSSGGVVFIENMQPIISTARSMLERPGSYLFKAWIGSYISLAEDVQRRPGANFSLQARNLQRDLRALDHVHREDGS